MRALKGFSERSRLLNLDPGKSKEDSFNQRWMFGRGLETEGKATVLRDPAQRGQAAE